MGREEAALLAGDLYAAAGWQRSRRNSHGSPSEAVQDRCALVQSAAVAWGGGSSAAAVRSRAAAASYTGECVLFQLHPASRRRPRWCCATPDTGAGAAPPVATSRRRCQVFSARFGSALAPGWFPSPEEAAGAAVTAAGGGEEDAKGGRPQAIKGASRHRSSSPRQQPPGSWERKRGSTTGGSTTVVGGGSAGRCASFS